MEKCARMLQLLEVSTRIFGHYFHEPVVSGSHLAHCLCIGVKSLLPVSGHRWRCLSRGESRFPGDSAPGFTPFVAFFRTPSSDVESCTMTGRCCRHRHLVERPRQKQQQQPQQPQPQQPQWHQKNFSRGSSASSDSHVCRGLLQV